MSAPGARVAPERERSPRVTKVLALRISTAHGPVLVTAHRRIEARNARPTARLPRLGRTCGRREQEAGAGCPGVILLRLVHVTVEGTLVSRKTCAFAGARRSGGLGRSVSSVVGLLPYGRSRRRQRGVSWTPRRGTSSAYANQGVRTRSGRHRPQRDRGRVLRSVQEPAHRHGRSHDSREGGRGGSSRLREGSPGTPRSGPGSTSGKPGKPGRTDDGTGSSGCCAARRASAHATVLRAGGEGA